MTSPDSHHFLLNDPCGNTVELHQGGKCLCTACIVFGIDGSFIGARNSSCAHTLPFDKT